MNCRVSWNELQYMYPGTHLLFEVAAEHFNRFPKQRVPGLAQPELAGTLDFVKSLQRSAKDYDYDPSNAQYDFDTMCWKYVGPQHGYPAVEDLEEKSDPYYANCEERLVLPNHDPWVEGLLARLINPEVCNFPSARQLWYKTSPSHRSIPGIIGRGDRREKNNHALAMKLANMFPERVEPCILGTKDERNKIRPIFMASQADSVRYAKYLPYMHDCYAHLDVVAWRGDGAVERHLSEFYAHHPRTWTFESDYETMDTWVRKEHSDWVISAQERLTQTDLSSFASYMRNYFEVPLILPGSVRTGTHSLFSGLPPTNDLESQLNLRVVLAFIHKLFPKAEYGRDFVIVVLGDDVVVILDLDTCPYCNDIARDFSQWVWEEFRIKARADKQRAEITNSSFFCKRNFSRFGKSEGGRVISRYSLTLAANALENPKNYSTTEAHLIARSLMILDGLYGHKYWRALSKYVGMKLPNVKREDVERASEALKEWWVTRVTWDYNTSPTARLLLLN